MKHLFLFLTLVLSTSIFSQNLERYFDFSKESYYHNKMSDWKTHLYSVSDSKFEILTDQPNTFVFTASNHIMYEMIILHLDDKQRITKIEEFFFDETGDLKSWFPYRYPIKLNEIFNKLGDPNVNSTYRKYTSPWFSSTGDLTFNNYYKWEKILYEGTRVDYEIGVGDFKEIKINRKGNPRYTGKSYEFGYTALTPLSKGAINK